MDNQIRLVAQRSGGLVPSMRTVPLVLTSDETALKYEPLIERWVHNVALIQLNILSHGAVKEEGWKLSSSTALWLSFSKVGVWVERNLLYEFAHLKARQQLPMDYRNHTPCEVY